MAGCCSGSSCAFETTCYDYSQISLTPSLTETYDAFGIYCADAAQPACVTWTYPGVAGGGVTDYGCDTSAYIMNLYTTGTYPYVTGSTEVISKIFVTTANDETLSSYSSEYATASKSNQALASSGMHRASSTPVTVATSTASHTGSGSSSSSSSSPSTGAIAGGVVGGVAGGAAIGAAAIFFFLQRRKRQRKAADPSDLGQSGYQNVSENQSGHSSGHYTLQMQPPSEMMGSEPSHNFPEAEGSIPGSTAQEIDSKGLIAELPADYESQQKGLPTDYDTKREG